MSDSGFRKGGGTRRKALPGIRSAKMFLDNTPRGYILLIRK